MSIFLQNIIDNLGLNRNNGLFYFEEPNTWTDQFSFQIKRNLTELKPFAFYCFDKKPFILFFKLNDVQQESILHQKIWNFQIPIIFIENCNQIQIFNGFSLDKEKKHLIPIPSNDLHKIFTFENIHTEIFWNNYSRIFSTKKLDDYLLENITFAIDKLIKNGLERKYANNLIGRLIFIRYLIDRNVNIGFDFLDFRDQKSSFNDIIVNKKLLYMLFFYLKDKFNGNMFPIDQLEYFKVKEKHLQLLQRLFLGEYLEKGQLSLFDVYDFNIIPVELISNIYERFIGKERQNKLGAFYTPIFLVDYVLHNTVDLHLINNYKCQILDPACGSGIFLVESLRRIIEKNISRSELTDNALQNVLVDNIFGMDCDENAVNVAIFSLYLTLLDYKVPKEIETFKFPALLNKNFFVLNYFDSQALDKYSNIDFDFIIGNPPWGSKPEDDLHKAYVDNLNSSASSNGKLISDYQIAQSFILRSKEFSSNSTRCAFIITSKIFYNIDSKCFRKYILSNFNIEKIMDLSPVRKYIFDKVTGPAAIVFYNYNYSSNSVVEHTSIKPSIFLKLFKFLVIEKYDVKNIAQKYFLNYDWLFKTLLYGNVLDFHFIRRLKEDLKFPTINNIISKNKLISGVGLKRKDGNKKKDAADIMGIKFLDTAQKELKRFSYKTSSNWTDSFVGNLPNVELFQPPMALIKKGLSTNFDIISTFSNENLIFTDSVTSIKGTSGDSNVLKNIVGLFNSQLFKYFIFNIGSSTGTEREQAHNAEEKFTFPALRNSKLVEVVDKLLNLYSSQEKDFFSDSNCDILEDNLNSIISKYYLLSDTEKDLVNYTIDISIPLFRSKYDPFYPPSAEELSLYASRYLKYFNSFLSKSDKYLTCNIFGNNITRLIVFRIENLSGPLNSNNNNHIKFISENDFMYNNNYSRYYNYSRSNNTPQFFIQKDIKGFEHNSFYVMKPSERKNWHPAIAHLDISEFMEAIIRAGKKKVEK